MAWVQLSIVAEKGAVDSVSELMAEYGAVSVTWSDAVNQPLYEPDPGTTPLWNQITITGLYAENTDLMSIQDAITQQLSSNIDEQWKVERLQDRVWERTWLDHLRPMQFGERLWVCPVGTAKPNDQAVFVELDPGLAFGTGTHPTTSLCLEWLDSADLTNKTVIDYGCGSGILAIAAALLGADKVYAVDIDDQALTATHNNAATNQVNQRVFCCQPEALPPLKADILIANILSVPLIDLSDRFADLLRSGAQVVLSGILEHQVSPVRKAYTRRCTFSKDRFLGDWARLNATKN